MTFGLHCAPKRGKCYHGPDQNGNHAVPFVCLMGNQIKSVARPPQPACDNVDKAFDMHVVLSCSALNECLGAESITSLWWLHL